MGELGDISSIVLKTNQNNKKEKKMGELGDIS